MNFMSRMESLFALSNVILNLCTCVLRHNNDNSQDDWSFQSHDSALPCHKYTRAFVLPLIYIGKLKTRKRNKPKNSKCILAKFHKLRIIYINIQKYVCGFIITDPAHGGCFNTTTPVASLLSFVE